MKTVLWAIVTILAWGPVSEAKAERAAFRAEAAALVAGPSPVSGPKGGGTGGTLDEIKAKLEASYSGLPGLSMSFEQVNSWADLPEAGEVSRGKLWAAGANRMRMEYSEPPGHLLVSDGARVWVYVPENRQAVVDSVGVGEGAALAEMIMNFLAAGRVTLLGREEIRGARCHVLLVEEVSKPPGLESVRIWVDARTWLARGLELKDLNDNITTFTFWDIKRLKKVDGDLFSFKAPPGVEVVESPLGTDGEE